MVYYMLSLTLRFLVTRMFDMDIAICSNKYCNTDKNKIVNRYIYICTSPIWYFTKRFKYKQKFITYTLSALHRIYIGEFNHLGE